MTQIAESTPVNTETLKRQNGETIHLCIKDVNLPSSIFEMEQKDKKL